MDATDRELSDRTPWRCGQRVEESRNANLDDRRNPGDCDVRLQWQTPTQTIRPSMSSESLLRSLQTLLVDGRIASSIDLEVEVSESGWAKLFQPPSLRRRQVGVDGSPRS